MNNFLKTAGLKILPGKIFRVYLYKEWCESFHRKSSLKGNAVLR